MARSGAALKRTDSAEGVVEYTRAQAEAWIEREAKAMTGVSAKEAFRKLDRGELRGTLAEARLNLLRGLIAE